METISSSSNPRIKLIRKLKDRKERDQSGLYFFEGLRIVGEAVQQNAELVELYVAPDILKSEFGWEMVAEVEKRGIPVCSLSVEVFRQISIKEGPQGIAGLARQRWLPLDKLELNPGDSWVALDSPQDPGNVGTILRVNDAVGGKGIIFIDHSTDPYEISAIRGSMGAIFNQELVKTDFESFSAWKRAHQTPVIGSSGTAAADYHTAVYPVPMILLMGSERMGLQPHHLNLCDQVVAIPMVGRSDSLNLAVATGIILYEIYNHRRDLPTAAGHDPDWRLT